MATDLMSASNQLSDFVDGQRPDADGGGSTPATTSPIDRRLARRVLLALLSQPLWVTRTVEAVTFVDRHTVRRRISRHYTLPVARHRPKLPGPGANVRLPVFGIPKGQFLSCDLIDESRRAVSLPPLPERARYSAAALQYLASQIVAEPDPVVLALIEAFVVAGPLEAEERLSAAQEHPEMSKLFADPHFDQLATYLAHNYLVFVDVAAKDKGAPARRVIRFELDVRFPHTRRELKQLNRQIQRRQGYSKVAWEPTPRRFRPPFLVRYLFRPLGLMSYPYHHFVGVDGAGSLHLDVEATEGVAFGMRRLRFRNAARQVYTAESHGASSRRARFLLPRTKGRGSAAMTIFIRPAPGVLRNGSFTLLIGFTLLLALADRHYDALAGKAAAVPLLFILPGLVSVVAARPNEHPYVAGVLVGIRLLTVVPVPLSVIVAFILVTKGPQDVVTACTIFAGVCAAILTVGRVIDELQVKPQLAEFVEDDLTRVG